MPDDNRAAIRSRLASVEARIRGACDRAGRDRNDVTVVAVTKGRTVDEVRAAVDAGLTHLGENRVEELEVRRPLIEGWAGAEALTWHMIGHIQSRKAERAVVVSDLIHSVDTVRLAERLDRAAEAHGHRVPVLVQVNISGEAAKSGLPCATPDDREVFLQAAREMAGLRNLDFRGLMTIAPVAPDPEAVRPVFRGLRELRDLLREREPRASWDMLSMGMTDDFEVAIQEGATVVRIGRGLFGPTQPAQRDYP